MNKLMLCLALVPTIGFATPVLAAGGAPQRLALGDKTAPQLAGHRFQVAPGGVVTFKLMGTGSALVTKAGGKGNAWIKPGQNPAEAAAEKSLAASRQRPSLLQRIFGVRKSAGPAVGSRAGTDFTIQLTGEPVHGKLRYEPVSFHAQDGHGKVSTFHIEPVADK